MRRQPVLIAIATLVLLLAACGGDDEPLASPSVSGSPSTSMPSSPGFPSMSASPSDPGTPPDGTASGSGSPSVPTSPRPSDAPSASPSPTVRLDPEVAAFLALCSVGADVAAEDLVSAEETFHDEVHDALHDLADDLEDVNRGLSALLLQSKSRVEADFAKKRIDVQILTADLTELTRATEAGLLALGFDSPGCPEQPQ